MNDLKEDLVCVMCENILHNPITLPCKSLSCKEHLRDQFVIKNEIFLFIEVPLGVENAPSKNCCQILKLYSFCEAWRMGHLLMFSFSNVFRYVLMPPNSLVCSS